MLKPFIAALLSLLLVSGAQAHDHKLHVVASFSILGDLVKSIAGNEVELYVLVGPDSDAHAYQPTPQDVKAIAKADLVIVNGLGFEGWMERLIESSGFKGTIVTASKGIHHIKMPEADEDHEAHDEHSHTHHGYDPHAWQDVNHAKHYVETIRDTLMSKDNAHAEIYAKNSADYLAKLTVLNEWIGQEIATIPATKRKLITSHDAFQYFAKAYGVTILAPLGINAESEPSAKELAQLIDQIRAQNITALFVESITDPRLIQQLVNDGNATMGGTLYSDALSKPDGAAPTYIEMMKHNTALLVKAMKNNP